MTGEKREVEHKPCRCPYCNGATEEPLAPCGLCSTAIVRCPSCGKVLEQEDAECPGCGAQRE